MLPSDICRCSNDACSKADRCRRFLALEDKSDYYPVMRFLEEDCKMFMEAPRD